MLGKMLHGLLAAMWIDVAYDTLTVTGRFTLFVKSGSSKTRTRKKPRPLENARSWLLRTRERFGGRSTSTRNSLRSIMPPVAGSNAKQRNMASTLNSVRCAPPAPARADEDTQRFHRPWRVPALCRNELAYSYSVLRNIYYRNNKGR